MHCTLTGICTVHLQTLKYLKCIGMSRASLWDFIIKSCLNIFVNTRKSGIGYYHSSGLATQRSHYASLTCLLLRHYTMSGAFRVSPQARASGTAREPELRAQVAVKHTFTHDVIQMIWLFLRVCARLRWGVRGARPPPAAPPAAPPCWRVARRWPPSASTSRPESRWGSICSLLWQDETFWRDFFYLEDQG